MPFYRCTGGGISRRLITGTFEGSSGYEPSIEYDGSIERVYLRRQLSPRIGCMWLNKDSNFLMEDISGYSTVNNWSNSAWSDAAIGTATTTVPNIKAIGNSTITFRLPTQNYSGTWEYAIVTSGGAMGVEIQDTTAIAADVAVGKIFHLSNGRKAIGTANIGQSVSGVVPWANGSQTEVRLGWKPKFVYAMAYLNGNRTHLLAYDERIAVNKIFGGTAEGLKDYAIPNSTNNRIIGNITDTGFVLNSFGVANGQCYYYAIG